ncbi:hypothetical protein AX16_004500 [Volvariella volvacea WC 439]|nr:hypothetical protein AX16_004500 [Volvariella volvacea WC 439]
MAHHHHDYVAANEAFFNENAHKFDDVPHAIERAQRVAAAVRNFHDLDKETTTVMEFACGTGLVSKELVPYVKSIFGVDISQGVVDQFNQRVQKEGISSEKMKGIRAELKGTEGELDNIKFDVIVCASAYHHFPSVEDVTKTLAFFLKPGGALVVADIIKGYDMVSGFVHPGPWTKEEVTRMVPHTHGFDEEDMRKVFEGAGLGSFTFDSTSLVRNAEKDAGLFLAKGIKPLSV